MSDSGVVEFIGGILFGFMLTILLIIMGEATSADGYRNAYRDSKKGTMETYVKKHYPKLWIEYNAPDAPGEKDGR